MKIAILSFDHIDSILSLSRYLGKNKDIEVNLYLVISQKYKTASVLNLQRETLKNGLLSYDETRKLLPSQMNEYVENYVNCRLFIYNSVKIYDPKNLILTHKLARHLKKEEYDIVHFNGTSGVLVQLHLALKNLPRVNSVHDPLPHSGESSWFLKLLFKTLFKFDIEYILHADLMARLFSQYYKVSKNKAHAIYYGALEIYRFFLTSNPGKTQNLILFIGRISPYKGIEYLIEAAKIVKKSIPDLKVIIAGNGEFYFDIENISTDKTFEIINRYIPNEELTKFIEKSSMVICPYTDATQSGVVMTAYAFNRPVIATDVGGMPEVVENNVTGKLVPPKNPEALAEAISDLLSNPQKLEIMGENIRRKCQSEKFSWYYIATQTMDVYKKAIEEKK
jgi:glycosyltransferase involved in cell wall biosynthesis